MQSLNTESPRDTLHWQGTIQDGFLLLREQEQLYQFQLFSDFNKHYDLNFPSGCGSRLLFAAYGMAAYCWESSHKVDADKLSTVLDVAAQKLINEAKNSAAQQLIANHLMNCIESHEHMLNSQELAARLFIEVKRLHHRHRNCLNEIIQHKQLKYVSDENCEPYLLQESSSNQNTLTITGIGFNTSGAYISTKAMKHINSQQQDKKAILILDNFHLVHDKSSFTAGHYQNLSWNRIETIITPLGSLSPNNWQQLITWGKQEWESSFI